jgi:hypothetical protein
MQFLGRGAVLFSAGPSTGIDVLRRTDATRDPRAPRRVDDETGERQTPSQRDFLLCRSFGRGDLEEQRGSCVAATTACTTPRGTSVGLECSGQHVG